MKRILIVGGGVAGRKFVKALVSEEALYHLTLCSFGIMNKTIALAKEYTLGYIPYDELESDNICLFDCVIICVPIDAKKEVTTHILSLGYKNALILEKPLAITQEDCIYYQNLLQSLERYYVSYWRDFSDCHVDWIRDNKSEIDYASVFRNLRQNIIHNFPHLLAWILRTTGNISNIHISAKDSNSLYGFMNNCPMSIRFENPDTPIFKVNNVVLPTFDQPSAYRKMVDAVFKYTKADSRLSITNSIAISKILEEALSINGN